MFDDYKDVLTIPEVMEILHIGKNRTYELLNAGILKGFRVNIRTWLIPKESVELYVRSQVEKQNKLSTLNNRDKTLKSVVERLESEE